MKSFAVLAMCCIGAQAFVPVPKAGPVPGNAPCRDTSSTALEAKSKALPFLESPATLDGTMIGDFGFDPLGLTENIDLPYGERRKRVQQGKGGDGMRWEYVYIPITCVVSCVCVFLLPFCIGGVIHSSVFFEGFERMYMHVAAPDCLHVAGGVPLVIRVRDRSPYSQQTT